MKRLQRYQNVNSLAFWTRFGNAMRNGLTTKLINVMRTAEAMPAKKIGSDSATTETKAKTTNAISAINAARVVTSIRCLTIANSEGNKVIDAIIMSNTPMTAPIARPRANARPMRKSPRSEMITVMPAKMTARPEVSTASTTASSTLRPFSRPSRYRVTINNA